MSRTAKPESRYKPLQVTLRVAPQTGRDIDVIKAELSRRRGRQVTNAEVVADLVLLWKTQTALDQAAEAGQ